MAQFSRYTLDLAPELFERIKTYAKEHGLSFRQVVIRGVTIFMDENHDEDHDSLVENRIIETLAQCPCVTAFANPGWGDGPCIHCYEARQHTHNCYHCGGASEIPLKRDENKG